MQHLNKALSFIEFTIYINKLVLEMFGRIVLKRNETKFYYRKKNFETKRSEIFTIEKTIRKKVKFPFKIIKTFLLSLICVVVLLQKFM